MSDEQHGRESDSHIFASVLSSVGLGSSISPLSSLQATGRGAVIPARSYQQKVVNSCALNITCTKQSFVEQVKTDPDYGGMVNANSEYELKLVHGTKQLHWFLLVKMFKSDLPYLTIEITTSTDLCDIIPTIHRAEDNAESENQLDLPSVTILTDVGTYKGTLHRLYQVADEVVEDMKKYNLITSNCQHFCNNVLRKIGKKTYSTTVGPKATEDTKI